MIQPISAIVFSMQDFIHQANHYGQAKRPFFFLIDFEQQKPLIFPLEQAHASGLFLNFFANRISKSRLKNRLKLLNYRQIRFRLANTKPGLN